MVDTDFGWIDAHSSSTDTATVCIAADAGNPPAATNPGQLAYIMYTSGSTGQPKGIGITHRDVAALATDRRWQDGSAQRVLLHSPQAFDASTYELWVPLLNGGTLVIAPPGELDSPALAHLITQQRISGLWLTAGLFHLLAQEHPSCFAAVRQSCGAEARRAESLSSRQAPVS